MTLSTASEAARTAALVVPEPLRATVRVTGTERASWLNGVVTCDVSAAAPGRAVFGLLLSKVGKIQADFYLVAGEQALFLELAPGTSEAALVELSRMLVMEDAELEPSSGALACVSLHGPRAPELAEQVAGSTGLVWGELDTTGLGGAVLLVPAGSLDATLAALAAGGGHLATDEEWQALRLERGVAVYGVDYGPADNPHEAALDRRAVSWNKGCYLGQEVVFMQDARGKVKRRLALLSVEGGAAPGAELFTPSGEAAGEVTSASPSTRAGGTLALARVKAPHFEPGTRLTLGGAPAVVRSGPV